MITKRIIPCLDVRNGRVVKGTNFVELRDAGDPVEAAKLYNAQGADELLRSLKQKGVTASVFLVQHVIAVGAVGISAIVLHARAADGVGRIGGNLLCRADFHTGKLLSFRKGIQVFHDEEAALHAVLPLAGKGAPGGRHNDQKKDREQCDQLRHFDNAEKQDAVAHEKGKVEGKEHQAQA